MPKSKFDPDVEVLAPNSQSRADHLGTVRIRIGPRTVHVLVHENFLRFRINHTPSVISEAFLSGKRADGFAIIRVDPA